MVLLMTWTRPYGDVATFLILYYPVSVEAITSNCTNCGGAQASYNRTLLPSPSPPHLDMAALATNTLVGAQRLAPRLQKTRGAKRASFVTQAGKYDDELLETATNMTKPGKGILAMDESNATCGSRLEGVGVENTEENRRRYRELLITTPNLGEHIGGAILFEETLYQSTADGRGLGFHLRAQLEQLQDTFMS